MPFVNETFIMVGIIEFFVTARFTILHYVVRASAWMANKFL